MPTSHVFHSRIPYKDKWEEGRVCYLHLRAAEPEKLADALRAKGDTVLGVFA